MSFPHEYKKLNSLQKQAVDNIDGPLLVIAGPGTGKTQLLSMRVANILKQQDLGPGNILCLTFTDNAARNMRERLIDIIGQPAYHVAIHTFHSLGSDIINQYPDFFTDRQLLQQVDELGKYQLLQDIFERLPHSNPLSTKMGEQFVHLKDVQSTLSWLKQNGLQPTELHQIIKANQKFFDQVNLQISGTFADATSPQQLPQYVKLLEAMQKQATAKPPYGFADYGQLCAVELAQTITETPVQGRYAPPITAWRNSWCAKDSSGNFVLKDSGRNLQKMQALADIYEQMLSGMAVRGLYDFDDMVIEAVHAIESQDELRYNLQERYQYILVDEFQDTNKAQLRLLNALGDNPANAGRPNIMAVGDDDQAIYAFQGAETSNMVAFAQTYQPSSITLEENYRSTDTILEISQLIAKQITDRLSNQIPGINKQLTAQTKHQLDELTHLSFSSEVAQYEAVSQQIAELVKKGTSPDQIAVIAPRHKYLERLMPYLGNRQIPVAYERRENILDAPIIKQLLTMSELITAIAENRQEAVDQYLSEVLAYDFFDISSEDLIDVSMKCYNSHQHWLEVLSKHSNQQLREITLWFVKLARRSRLQPMEYILDQLIGNSEAAVDSEFDDIEPAVKGRIKFTSPLRTYYFNEQRYENSTEQYLTLLGQLSTLRQRLRLWQPTKTLFIEDLVEFSALHQNANLKIIDTNPHTQTTKAVQVMTVHKAKGLEFDYVFAINAQDEVWGPTARSNRSRLSLPKNLPIEPAGESDNDKLRLLFVAMTRTKHTLIITSYKQTMDGKTSPPLSFITYSEKTFQMLQPTNIDKPATIEAVQILSTDWAYRFRQIIADKPTLLEPILANYKLSVTHLNNFIDVANAGPDYFFMHNLLRFPAALSPSAAYGDAIHRTIHWLQTSLKQSGKLPSHQKTLAYFSDMLKRTHLSKADHRKMDQRGHESLKLYLSKCAKHFSAGDLAERGFNNEGVVINQARLSGKIDIIKFSGQGSVQVIDFKTGKPADSWQGKDAFERIKLHKYRQQLMFYKLLVENSASFSKKLTVNAGELEFIESDQEGKLVNNLELSFAPDELTRFATLIGAVWQHIITLNFPDVSSYPTTLDGIKQFEQDLINDKI